MTRKSTQEEIVKLFAKFGIKPIDKYVNSYHDFGILKEILSKELIPIYYSGKSIEMCLGKRKKIMGIMWHPERNKKFSINDIKLFKNFFPER